jgi:hypothetical protein
MIPRGTHVHVGSLLFGGIDQIDLTGPFEVLSRIPNSIYRIYGKTTAPVRDLKGLWLTPDAALADAPPLDIPHVPGSFGQEVLMEDAEVRHQAAGACSIFTVCTGALLCGAAGLVKGYRRRRAGRRFTPCPILVRSPSTNEWLSMAPGCSPQASRLASTCVAPRGRVARRGGRTGHPTSHGLSAGAALQQRHARDGASRDTGSDAAIRARHHRAAGRDGTTCGHQTRHRHSGRRRRMTSLAQAVWREARAYWRTRQQPASSSRRSPARNSTATSQSRRIAWTQSPSRKPWRRRGCWRCGKKSTTRPSARVSIASQRMQFAISVLPTRGDPK